MEMHDKIHQSAINVPNEITDFFKQERENDAAMTDVLLLLPKILHSDTEKLPKCLLLPGKRSYQTFLRDCSHNFSLQVRAL